MREVFGTTSNLTAMQPLVIVEGVEEKYARVIPDRKLYVTASSVYRGIMLAGKSAVRPLLPVARGLHLTRN